MKNSLRRNLFIFIAMGIVYINLEVITRAVRMELVGWNGIKAYSLAGWTSLWMFPVGGLCGLLIGRLNKKSNMHMALMSLFGTLIIFSIELLSGLIFNVWLGMHIWDYSNLPLNILGQVSLVYLLPWYFISPLAVWLDDLLRFLTKESDQPSPLFDYYLNIFRKKQK